MKGKLSIPFLVFASPNLPIQLLSQVFFPLNSSTPYLTIFSTLVNPNYTRFGRKCSGFAHHCHQIYSVVFSVFIKFRRFFSRLKPSVILGLSKTFPPNNKEKFFNQGTTCNFFVQKRYCTFQ